MMKRGIVWALGILLLGGLAWYLFVKPYDYLITFKVKALPGTINQTVKLWKNSLQDAELIKQESLSDFTYLLNHNDSIFTYRYTIDRLNDSISKVRVFVTNPENSLQHKLTVPFSKKDFVKRSEQTVKETFQTIDEHLKRIKVTLVGESEIPETFCICTGLADNQRNKANGMMQNYTFLSSVVLQNKLQPNGSPFVEITDWQIEKDSITFNFCNPIIKQDSLPNIDGLFYKKIENQKALKAIYNGNYITSDRAWYHLLDYADKNEIVVETRPFEIFNSNPNLGSDELRWEAEIFMPLKHTDE